MLHRLMPDEAEVTGLLALMLLTDARRAARTGPVGELVPLDRQDRALWKAERIAEGVALITDALPRGEVGPYQVQAAIAAVHDEAPSFEATDWPQILSLYELLLTMADTPLARLSHAIALAMVNGTAAGLARLTELEADARLRDHHRLEAARAHLLERDGRIREAAALTRPVPRSFISLVLSRDRCHAPGRAALAHDAAGRCIHRGRVHPSFLDHLPKDLPRRSAPEVLLDDIRKGLARPPPPTESLIGLGINRDGPGCHAPNVRLDALVSRHGRGGIRQLCPASS
jgi:hypothetical protein